MTNDIPNSESAPEATPEATPETPPVPVVPESGPVARFRGGPLDCGLLSRPVGVELPDTFDAGRGVLYVLDGDDYVLAPDPDAKPADDAPAEPAA